MKPWLLFAFAGLGCWGVWGVFANLASRRLDAASSMVWEVVGAVVVAVVAVPFVLRAGGGLGLDGRGVAYAMLTGVSYTVGLMFVFLALSAGRAAHGPGSVHTILVLTALYPFVASLLNLVVVGEPITARQLLAMALAVGALLLLTTENASPS